MRLRFTLGRKKTQDKGRLTMIPSNFQRSGRSGGRTNLPLPLVIAAAAGVLVLVVFAWVALSMGSAPATEPVTADVPVKL